MKMENLIKIKFIEVPIGYSIQEKIYHLNVWINDMQRNGINILSTSNLQRVDNSDGSFTEGFTVEYREMS